MKATTTTVPLILGFNSQIFKRLIFRILFNISASFLSYHDVTRQAMYV